jgi:hypothetical protein
MSQRYEDDEEDSEVYNATSSVRTVGSYAPPAMQSPQPPQPQSSRMSHAGAVVASPDPLFAADALGGQSMRHAQRRAMARNGGSGPAAAGGRVVPRPTGGARLPPTTPAGAPGHDSFEASYDIDNSNYAINQRFRQHLSLNAEHGGSEGGGVAIEYRAEDGSCEANMDGADYHQFSAGLSAALNAEAAEMPYSDSSIHLLLPPDADGGPYTLSPKRWWVLIVFCFLSFNQSFIWITFSPITEKAEAYYGITEADADLLLNWG